MATVEERAALTARIKAALALPAATAMLVALTDIPAKKRLKPLFSALLAPEALVRWRAVVALGATVATVAAAQPEEGRELWRSLMWRLNEESGTIGWGIPEVMGETLARSPALADDYARLLVALVRDLPGAATAYLDHPGLRLGAWWGIARLAEARPDLAGSAVEAVPAALAEAEPGIRGLACVALTRIGTAPAPALAERLTALREDTAVFLLYADDRLTDQRVGDWARRALDGGDAS